LKSPHGPHRAYFVGLVGIPGIQLYHAGVCVCLDHSRIKSGGDKISSIPDYSVRLDGDALEHQIVGEPPLTAIGIAA